MTATHTFNLTVPTFTPTEGAPARWVCCRQEVSGGHAERCTSEAQRSAIAAALDSLGSIHSEVPSTPSSPETSKLRTSNLLDADGNPAGGTVDGVGIEIRWQDGPLGRGSERKAPNGALVEDVIAAAVQRIQFYQAASGGKFACRENALAITRLEEALHWLHARTRAREERRVEGTHAP